MCNESYDRDIYNSPRVHAEATSKEKENDGRDPSPVAELLPCALAVTISAVGRDSPKSPWMRGPSVIVRAILFLEVANGATISVGGNAARRYPEIARGMTW